jgi:hypothetical protein
MIIPPEALSADALVGLISEFVLREGTEYGTTEVSLETKVAQVRRQIDDGDVVIVFDEATESCDLITKGSKRYKEILLSLSK